MTDSQIPAFGLLLRDYAYAYTASHDFDVCDRLMIEDYVLRMGEHEIRGRDAAYKPATARQYRQYPGLGFTVHDFMTTGDRAALRFSEHGRSARTGHLTSWQGISLYRWDGERLTECRVEQDYYSRRRQSETGRPHPVAAPAIDPWTRSLAQPSTAAEDAVRAWLESGEVLTSTSVVFDDEADAGRERAAIGPGSVAVLDLFSCGDRAAFHMRVDGPYAGGLDHRVEELRGTPGALYATGLVSVAPGSITGHVVTDRLSFSRRLEAS